MKTVNIDISKKDILEVVAINTAYTGAKNPGDSSIFERVATISEDDEMLSRHWPVVFGSLSDKLRNFIVDSQYGADSFSISLELSGAFDEAMLPGVKNDLFSYVAAAMTSHWFLFSFPEKWEEWEKRGRELLDSAVAKLCVRRRPVRNRV
ncbi:MAG: hypothetical protein J1F12_00955 [Muribaculaceae bacterium]|nr:hypothetical protein [Muribaculaceae bacterium]